MQPAPAVSVDWRTGLPWIVGALLFSVTALASSLLWAAGVGGLGWLLPAVSVLLIAAGLWSLRPQPLRRLRWDGQAWWLAPTSARSETRVEVRLMPDPGAHLLLRLDAAQAGWRRRRHWLALSRPATAGDWHGLRCALYCPGVVWVLPAAADPPL